MKIGAVILCGGQSSRMGKPKEALTFHGETFLQRIEEQLKRFDEVLLSVSGSAPGQDGRYRVVPDQYPGCGPMGGLHAALSACRSDALLAVPCDTPLFRGEFADLLCQSMTSCVDAVIPQTPDGYLHPLCAVYRKETAGIFHSYLQAGQYRLLHALQDMRVSLVPVSEQFLPCLENVNTPEAYLELLERCR